MTRQLPLASRQSGSVFFIIMVSLVLFGVLTTVMLQSMSGNSGSPSGQTKEQMDLSTAQVMQFCESMKTKVYMMTSTNGVAETLLSFSSVAYKSQNGAANCANVNNACTGTTNSCYLFSPYSSAAGMTPLVFRDIASKEIPGAATQSMNGHVQVAQVAISGVGTSAPDLVAIVQGVEHNFCNLYNAKQGITSAYTRSASTFSTMGETESTSVPEAFGGCGANGAFSSTHVIGDEATAYAGKRTFCAPKDISSRNSRLGIYCVIKAR